MLKRKIHNIVIHCSATPEGRWVDSRDIRAWHVGQGWKDIGYHYVILLDGTIEKGRPDVVQGAHVKGHNGSSIGVCYVGGVGSDFKPKDTRTNEQMEAMEDLIYDLLEKYPKAKIMGHNEFPGVKKACPSFDVQKWVDDCDFYDY